MNDYLGYQAKRNSEGAYRTALRRFLEYVYGWEISKRQSDREKYEEASRQYLEGGSNYFDDLFGFLKQMKEAGRSPSTLQQYKTAVVGWLEFNEIEFKKVQLKKLQSLARGSPVTREEPLDRERIRKILDYMDIKGRAAVLVMASGGLRPRELLGITLDDIELDVDPARVLIREEMAKTGEQRVTFISSEAAETLREWMGVREDYIKASVNRNRGLVAIGKGAEKKVEDKRVFPFSKTLLWEIWSNALEKAGFDGRDKRTKRKVYRLQGLRKFFRTQLATAVPTDVVEALMGHSGYLTTYRRHTEQELADYYSKGEHTLLITPPKSLVEATNEVKEGLERNRELLEQYVLENQELRKKNQGLEERLETLEEEMGALKDLKRFKKRLQQLENKT